MNRISQFMKNVKTRNYSNFTDAFHWPRQIRKYTGSTIWEVHVLSPENRAKERFSSVGFLFFVFWNAFYIFCAFTAQSQDQTILRNLYSTKLRRYGDDFERISSFSYVLITMWLIPFRLSRNCYMVQSVLDVDKVIQDMGYFLDYNKYARATSLVTLVQLCIYFIRILCIWLPVNKTNQPMPYEKMFQVVYSDAQAIILTSFYCHCNMILLDRHKWINKVLEGIQTRSAWEYKVFTRRKMAPNLGKVIQIQERHVCEKIKSCARVYGMLFNVCEVLNSVFGFAMLITLFYYFNYMILYLFYFMEATATGLFHDVKRYIDLMVYAFWEVAIAFGVIFFILYYCESVMKEAKKTSVILHEIINADFSPEINIEAMQLSAQLLHEKPSYTALGLFDLNFGLIQQGARSVTTYLVILLQFVTENSQEKFPM